MEHTLSFSAASFFLDYFPFGGMPDFRVHVIDTPGFIKVWLLLNTFTVAFSTSLSGPAHIGNLMRRLLKDDFQINIYTASMQ